MTERVDGTVLVLNCGSSSLKFALFRSVAGCLERLIKGEAEEIGGLTGRFTVSFNGERSQSQEEPIADQAAAAQRVFDALTVYGAPTPRAVAHRIVHGGPSVRRHCVVDADVLTALEGAQILAPLHVPAALSVLRATQHHFKSVPQIACLDTAFHNNLPDVARRFPLGADLAAKGIERYGFHGLSCESILHQLGEKAPDRLVIAHLGGGSSVTAVKAGRSIDTSMGLTPTGGVMMATRSGDLDPGLLIYLVREASLNAEALEILLDRDAGMMGISGLSGDIRQLRAAGDNPDAQLAIKMFAYSVRKQVAAMAAVLEGIDMLVLTGGIGQNDVGIRAELCNGLRWLGLASEGTPATQSHSAIVRVFPANEELQMASIAFGLLQRSI